MKQLLVHRILTENTFSCKCNFVACLFRNAVNDQSPAMKSNSHTDRSKYFVVKFSQNFTVENMEHLESVKSIAKSKFKVILK